METKVKAQMTPGPWHVLGDNLVEFSYTDEQGNRHAGNICEISSRQGYANARAIAAVPDLIEALRGEWEYHHDGTPLEAMSDLERHTLEATEAALRKAGVL